MNLDYNEEYKSFEKEVQDFCKQYKDISFSDSAKIPFSAKGGFNAPYILFKGKNIVSHERK